MEFLISQFNSICYKLNYFKKVKIKILLNIKRMSKANFVNAGYFIGTSQSPFKGKGLSPLGKKFVLSQLSQGNNVSSFIPRGYVLTENTGGDYDIITESTYKKRNQPSQKAKAKAKAQGNKGKNKGKRVKFKAPKSKYVRRGKVATLKDLKGEKFVSGQINATFRLTNGKIETRQELFRLPFGVNWKPRILDEFENKYNPESGELISLIIVDYSIISFDNKKTTLMDIRLKKATFIKMDGFSEQHWNTGNDTCVFDYLYHTFWHDPHIQYDIWDKDFIADCFPNLNHPDPKKKGITINEIKDWCCNTGIKMLAFDENVELIDGYFPPVKSHSKALVFVVKHGHIYPYEDSKMKNSLSSKFSEKKVLNRRVKKAMDKKRKETKKLPFEFIKRKDRDCLQCVCDIIRERNIDIRRETLITNRSGVVSFTLENKKYYIENGDMSKIVEHYGDDFDGETPLSLMCDIMNEMDIPKSNFNKQTLEVLLSRGTKDLHHVGMFSKAMTSFFDEETAKWKDNVATVDIKRSYTSCINDPMDEWYQFEYADYFVPYDKETHYNVKLDKIPRGLYIVDTNDTTLFLKTGIYDAKCVKYGLVNKLITHSNIKYIMECHKTLPKTYFSKFNDIRDKMGLPDSVNKLITNSVCGMLGKTQKVAKRMYITTEIKEAYAYFYENRDIIDDCFFHEKVSGDIIEEEYEDEIFSQYTDEPITRKKMINEQKFYIYGHDDKTLWLKNNLPMFIQIICQQNIMLYTMMKNLGLNNILYRKSDALTFIDEDPKKTDKLCQNRPGGFLRCENPIKPVQKCYKNCEFKIPKQQWELRKDIRTSNDIQPLVEAITHKKSLVVSGCPGNGKSYQIRKLTEIYKDKCLRLAFTNVCAKRIDGETFHKAFRWNEKDDIVPRKILQQMKKDDIQCILLEEISMITASIWSVIRRVKDELGISIIGFGDSAQLKPVDGFENYLSHPDIVSIFDNQIAELQWHDKCRHTYDEYQQLMEIRNGNKDAVYDMNPIICDVSEYEQYPMYNICRTNKVRKDVNQFVLQNILATRDFINISHNCNSFMDKLSPEGIEQYVPNTYVGDGLEFMCFKTKYDGEDQIFTNGLRYKVISFDPKVIILEDEAGNEILIDTIVEFLNHFTLGYCMTNHKVIGLTLTEEYGIFEYQQADPEWCYVAVSRSQPLPNFKLFLDTDENDDEEYED